MKIYGFSGLGADKRVFEYLRLDYDFVPIDWIKPLKNESIENYACRFSKIIDTNEKYAILGVSFGGLIAVEVSKILKPQFTVLISSVETKKELSKTYQFLGKLRIISFIPHILFKPPVFLAYYFFNAKNKRLLKAILKDTDTKFAKWATQKLLTWKNISTIDNCIRIVGDKDKLFPPKKTSNQIVIKNAGHFMIVDNAEEINKILKKEIKKMIA